MNMINFIKKNMISLLISLAVTLLTTLIVGLNYELTILSDGHGLKAGFLLVAVFALMNMVVYFMRGWLHALKGEK